MDAHTPLQRYISVLGFSATESVAAPLAVELTSALHTMDAPNDEEIRARHGHTANRIHLTNILAYVLNHSLFVPQQAAQYEALRQDATPFSAREMLGLTHSTLQAAGVDLRVPNEKRQKAKTRPQAVGQRSSRYG